VSLPFVLLLLDFWPLGRMRICPPRPDQAASAPRRAAGSRSCWRRSLAYLGGGVLRRHLPGAAGGRRGESPGLLYAPRQRGGFLRPLSGEGVLAQWSGHLLSAPGSALRRDAPLLGISSVGGNSSGGAEGAALAVAVGRLAVVSGTLVPVIGLVQVGSQALADRYMSCRSLAWRWRWRGASSNSPRGGAGRRWRWRSSWGGAGRLGVSHAEQVAYWHDTITLFEHAAAVTSNNDVAHANLGRLTRTKGYGPGHPPSRRGRSHQTQHALVLGNLAKDMEMTNQAGAGPGVLPQGLGAHPEAGSRGPF